MGKNRPKGAPSSRPGLTSARPEKKGRKNGDTADSSSSSLPFFSWKVALVSGLSLAIIVPFTARFLAPKPEGVLDFRGASKESTDYVELGLEDIPLSQRHSLRKPYTVDLQQLLRIREENMKKYDFNYNRFGVDKRSNLSLEEYYDVYDGKWPVVITDVVPTWAASNWTRDFFKERYGMDRVTMKAVDNDLDNAVSLALPLELFHKNAHIADPHRWTYVEDELFIPRRPELRRDIGENLYLDEDYYQLFPEEVRPWNAMLLWGTQFSRSSLHIDPYNWTGTNAVLQGQKRWKLYPPGQDHFLYVMGDRSSGFPLDCPKYNSKVDTYEPDYRRFPEFKKAAALEFDQMPGEILLIPTGWFHQAYNVKETIAISSQTMNRNNFRIVLEEILKVESNIKRKYLPENIDDLSPAEQTRIIMSMLPNRIIEKGRAITTDILNQIQHGYEASRGMVPDALKEF